MWRNPNHIDTLLLHWILLLPLAGFVLLGLFGRRYIKTWSGLIGTLILGACTILSLLMAWTYFTGMGQSPDGAYRALLGAKHTWLYFSAGMSIDMRMLLDPISMMMIVIVSFVSLMVHVFSLGYMKGEERYATYYSFLSLFTFSMLGLVLAANLFQTYIFWELVGLSSYLLIGFYFERPTAVAAAKKAFIVTRFADLGLLVGILILSFHAGSLDIQTMIQRLTDAGSQYRNGSIASSFLGISALAWGLGLVFVGGAGKSAMFPLHIWLPDAMEGPTPVSALIHAATMVVAGVYLVARLFPVYADAGPGILLLIRIVGAVSALLAAIIACTQTDIKRVLAYSTMSQIGYMMFALGLAGHGGEAGLGYTASMFHLFTHAFFKSLLFLGAGAVIHFVHSNEMGDMGALRKLLPVTHGCFLIACLAISGMPPFAGFFSKEEILLAAWRQDKAIYFIGLLTSGLTAFYMFRLYFSIFWKKANRWYARPPVPGTDDTNSAAGQGGHHGHEGSLSMKAPLVILALCTILAGFVPFSRLVTSDGAPLSEQTDLLFSVAPVLIALTGIGLAAWLYKRESERPDRVAAAFGGLYKAARRKFYIDEVYLFVTKKVLFNGIARPASWIDRHVVDGGVNAVASVTGWISERYKALQSGRVQTYTLVFFAGIAGLAILVIYLW